MQWSRALPGKPANLVSGIVSSYGSIGAICESSRWLARRLARAVGATSLPIVELGAGYGSVTAVLPESAVSIEREEIRYEYLQKTHPDRTILDSCAIKYVAGFPKPNDFLVAVTELNTKEQMDQYTAALTAAVTRGRR